MSSLIAEVDMYIVVEESEYGSICFVYYNQLITSTYNNSVLMLGHRVSINKLLGPF